MRLYVFFGVHVKISFSKKSIIFIRNTEMTAEYFSYYDMHAHCTLAKFLFFSKISFLLIFKINGKMRNFLFIVLYFSFIIQYKICLKSKIYAE